MAVGREPARSLAGEMPGLTDADAYRKIRGIEEENARLRARVAALEAWQNKLVAFVGRYAVDFAVQIKRL